MGLVEKVKGWIRGTEPTLVDYEAYDQNAAAGNGGAEAGQLPADPTAENIPAPESGGGGNYGVLAKLGVGVGGPPPVPPGTGATYKIQQSYDALLQTVQELRAAVDGHTRRQDELLDRLSTLPQAAEALPQVNKMQADLLKMINERLAMHADQRRNVQGLVAAAGSGPGGAGLKKEYGEALQSIREQIEMGNEIDRQLVESFNRFSMMIDRLQLANQHAVDALQQVRDSYAASAMQMHEWIEKSRSRGGWMLGAAFLMAAGALVVSLMVLSRMAGK